MASTLGTPASTAATWAAYDVLAAAINHRQVTEDFSDFEVAEAAAIADAALACAEKGCNVLRLLMDVFSNPRQGRYDNYFNPPGLKCAIDVGRNMAIYPDGTATTIS